MSASARSACATLGALHKRGYQTTLEAHELVVRGAGPLPEDLRRVVEADTAAIKAALLLSVPPRWLVLMLDRYATGAETQVTRTVPKAAGGLRLDLFDGPEATSEEQPAYPENLRGGKPVKCTVRVSLKNIAASIAAEIGIPVLEWERLLPEVEAVAQAWTPPETMETMVYD